MRTKYLIPLWGAFLVSAALLLCGESKAETIESPIYRYGTPTAISISTSAYTKVPATSTLANRTAILVDNPSTNTAIMHGHIGNCTSTAISISAVLGPIEIAPSSNGGVINLGQNSCLWIISRHTSAENLTFQEVSQRYAP